MKRLLTLALAALSLTATAQRRITPAEYIEKYKHLAIADQEAYGIPASIKMAQAILESDAGNSRLAVQANNHFGIKCKSTWKGETIPHDDDAPQECFRKYPTAEDSFRDHADFLSNSARYERLFALDPMDYKAWAQGLKDCGYATSPQYPQLLINMIERHELYKLDVEQPMAAHTVSGPVASAPPPVMPAYDGPPTREPEQITLTSGPLPDSLRARVDIDNYAVSARAAGGYPVYHNNGSEFVVARRGDTYETVAATMGLKAKRLRKLNDAGTWGQPNAGEQVYIRPKASRAINGRVMHTAAKGETLRDVSQQYGIRLGALARLNRLDTTAKIMTGQQIRLM